MSLRERMLFGHSASGSPMSKFSVHWLSTASRPASASNSLNMETLPSSTTGGANRPLNPTARFTAGFLGFEPGADITPGGPVLLKAVLESCVPRPVPRRRPHPPATRAGAQTPHPAGRCWRGKLHFAAILRAIAGADFAALQLLLAIAWYHPQQL